MSDSKSIKPFSKVRLIKDIPQIKLKAGAIGTATAYINNDKEYFYILEGLSDDDSIISIPASYLEIIDPSSLSFPLLSELKPSLFKNKDLSYSTPHLWKNKDFIEPSAVKYDDEVYLPTYRINLQRDYYWSVEYQQELIWSIILDRPIPPISIVETYDEVLQIIDGKQRLNAIKGYMNNHFPLIYNNTLYYYRDLLTRGEDIAWKIREYNISTHRVVEIDPNSISDRDKLEWFLFMNAVNVPQNPERIQELKYFLS
jgi:hypothetical protein